jgi:hypothetical protein
MDSTQKPGRFPLRLPDDLDKEIRQLAQGNENRPAAGINDTIVFLIRKGLAAVKESKESGNKKPTRAAA